MQLRPTDIIYFFSNQLLVEFAAFNVFVAWVKVFKYLSFNKTMTQLSGTLSAVIIYHIHLPVQVHSQLWHIFVLQRHNFFISFTYFSLFTLILSHICWGKYWNNLNIKLLTLHRPVVWSLIIFTSGGRCPRNQVLLGNFFF